ncbi:MAG: peptide chain release factor N(5)-glutamine methyltransferase [Acidobacteriota bacterium]|nr:peptide chain release factor N(5)-glutamine methyltransferase [Acidobacteriota bacterium]
MTGPASARVLTWEELHRSVAAALPDAREARWMIEEASGERLAAVGGPVPEKAALRVTEMLRRRLAGEPLQYVLGSWSFRTLDLMVDRRVLIPRPETEQVVEAALAEIDRLRTGPGSHPGPDTDPGRRPGPGPHPGPDTDPGCRPDTNAAGGRERLDTNAAAGRERLTVVDLGTGSGAIALSLAAERTHVNVWAVDRSPDAVAVARANLAGLAGSAATRVRVVEGDWWGGLPAELAGHIDLVVSNPPYVSSGEMAELDPQVRDWEPRMALEAGHRGTEAIEAIFSEAGKWLAERAAAVIELAPHQAPEAEHLARQAGFVAEVRADLAGRPRTLVARR